MATKYILVGGHPWKAHDGGRGFCAETVKGFSEPIKILECMFARPKEVWEKLLSEDKHFFATHLPGKRIEFQVADERSFIEQIEWAHILYLKGGTTEQLVRALARSDRWRRGLNGKTIAGSSAGANAIAKYYYSLDGLALRNGLGLLPVKVLVHYRSDYNAPNVNWDKALNELKNYKEDLSVLTLAEGQFDVRTH